jgi:tape measure domain-containing protein
VVDAVSRYDSITVRLNAFEGSAAAGAAAFAKLQEMAKQPGLGLEQASSAYASLRALKESGPEAVAIIEAVAKANASMGGGAEEFGRAMNQIQQMLGKGKLMAEDINTISESIPNFRALIMDAFGTTDTKALNAKYSVDQLLKGIEEAAAKLPPPGETIKNNMDNIGDAWTRLKASIGDAGFIKSATGALGSFLDKLASVREDSKKQDAILAEMGVKAGLITNESARSRFFGGGLNGSAFVGTTSASANQSRIDAAAQAAAEEAKASAPRPADPATVKKAQKSAEDAAQARVAAFHRAAEEERKEIERVAAWRKRVDDDAEKADAKREDRNAADRAARQKAENAALLAEQKKVDAIREKFDRDQAKKEEERIERKERAKAAVATRFAEGSVNSAMVAFSPVDAMFDRMAQRNAEMEMGFARVTQGMALSFTSMLIKMAEEYAARAAIFGLLQFIPGMGGATGLLGGLGSFVFGGRASGGAMFPGVSYAYNERQGGEIFRPSTGGMASPNLQGRAGDSIVINLSGGATQADANRVARAIEQKNRGRLRTVTRRG